MKRYWSDYTSEEFSRLDRGSIVAVLPVGATEQHGPHLPLSVDSAIVSGMVAAIVGRLPEASRALFLPTQPIGKSNEHARYAGTLTFSAQTLISMWCEIGACVAASGVRKLVLLNSHGGQISIMDIVARELRARHGMMVFSVNWFGQGLPECLYGDHEMQHGIHAGDMETSVMLALDPENVDMGAARDFRSKGQDLAAHTSHLGLGRGAKPGWKIQDLSPGGACGEAHLATAAKGEATLDYAIGKLVEAMEEIDSLPADWLDDKPEW